ncbi:curli assembly protein CsgF [Nitrospira sp. M1]
MLNKMILTVITLQLAGLAWISAPINASELRHQFTNPNFGGNPFNAQPLLNSAVLQNNFENTETNDASTLEDFQSRLDRAILNRLSREVVAEVFGEESDLSAGSFNTGNFEVQISEDLDGVTIGIVDTLTGDATNIQVPFF